jgi:hypothetical protein
MSQTPPEISGIFAPGWAQKEPQMGLKLPKIRHKLGTIEAFSAPFCTSFTPSWPVKFVPNHVQKGAKSGQQTPQFVPKLCQFQPNLDAFLPQFAAPRSFSIRPINFRYHHP